MNIENMKIDITDAIKKLDIKKIVVDYDDNSIEVEKESGEKLKKVGYSKADFIKAIEWINKIIKIKPEIEFWEFF
ncbi:TPA: hypothetical protein I9071_003173, partial [Clostridium perfringens]|nr:hypothetical protein [Clostridium perfringens]